jgi:hypothetical protein
MPYEDGMENSVVRVSPYVAKQMTTLDVGTRSVRSKNLHRILYDILAAAEASQGKRAPAVQNFIVLGRCRCAAHLPFKRNTCFAKEIQSCKECRLCVFEDTKLLFLDAFHRMEIPPQ